MIQAFRSDQPKAMTKPKSFDSWAPEKQEEWRERERECARKWFAANREKAAQYWSKYRTANREKRVEKNRKYRAENREKILEKNRKYKAENREKMLEYFKKYRNQKAADQFFIMAGAAEQLSKLQPNQTDQ
jgi:hypothetical protein